MLFLHPDIECRINNNKRFFDLFVPVSLFLFLYIGFLQTNFFPRPPSCLFYHIFFGSDIKDYLFFLAPSVWQKLFFSWAMVLQSGWTGTHFHRMITISGHLGLVTGNQSYCDNITITAPTETKTVRKIFCKEMVGAVSNLDFGVRRTLKGCFILWKFSCGLELDFEMAISKYVMQTKTLIWRKKNRWRSWGLCGTDAGSPSEHLVLGSSPP